MILADLVRAMGPSTSYTTASTETTPQRNFDYLYGKGQANRNRYAFDPTGYITYNEGFIQILYYKTILRSFKIKARLTAIFLLIPGLITTVTFGCRTPLPS